MRSVIQGASQHHRFTDLLREGFSIPKQPLASLSVSARVCGPPGQRRDEGKCPRPAAVACVTDRSEVVLTSGGIVAPCPGRHPEQVLGQRHKLQVLQGCRGVELPARIVNG